MDEKSSLSVAIERLENSLTLSDAAIKIGVHRETLRRWAYEGKVKTFKHANRVRIHAEELARLVNGQ